MNNTNTVTALDRLRGCLRSTRTEIMDAVDKRPIIVKQLNKANARFVASMALAKTKGEENNKLGQKLALLMASEYSKNVQLKTWQLHATDNGVL